VNKKSLAIGLLLVLSTIVCFNINPVSAQERIIDSIDWYTSGTDTILNITVTHITPGGGGGYNPLNFIDHIELDMDGNIQTIGDVVIVPTADIQLIHFSVEYNMGAVTGTPTVYARANTLQITGEWYGPYVIPEFSLFLLVPFFIVGSIAVLLIKSKITAKSPK
jgi:hypothetical protein